MAAVLLARGLLWLAKTPVLQDSSSCGDEGTSREVLAGLLTMVPTMPIVTAATTHEPQNGARPL